MASAYPQGRDARGRPYTSMSRCSGCGATVMWATTPIGSRIALDIQPAHPSAGHRLYLVLERERDWRLATEIKNDGIADEVLDLGMGLRHCHFDTCPKKRPRARADLA